MEQAIPDGAQVHLTIGTLPPALPDGRLREREVRLSGGSVRRGFAPCAVLPCSVEAMMISVYDFAGRRAGAPLDILSPNSAAAPVAMFSAAGHEPGMAINPASPIIAPSGQVRAQFAQQLYGKPSVLQCDPYTTLWRRTALRSPPAPKRRGREEERGHYWLMHVTSDIFPRSWQLFSEFEEIIAIARDLQAHGRHVVAFATAALGALARPVR